MLVVGEADDASQTMRRPELVQEVELLQAEHALTATRQVEGRCGPHAAQADDDGVVAFHAPSLRA